MSRPPESFEVAYRATIYRALLPDGPLDWRIGEANRTGDERLRALGCQRDWALLTAVNPRSQQLGADENQRRLQALEETLQARAQRWFPAVHVDPAGRWPDEPSVLLLDPPEGLAEELGRRWQQHAIVRGGLGAAPELVWL